MNVPLDADFARKLVDADPFGTRAAAPPPEALDQGATAADNDSVAPGVRSLAGAVYA